MFNIFKKKNYRFNTINNNNRTSNINHNNINNSLFNTTTNCESIIASRYNTIYRPNNENIHNTNSRYIIDTMDTMDTWDDIINNTSSNNRDIASINNTHTKNYNKDNRNNTNSCESMDTSADSHDLMHIKTKSKVSSVGVLEIEIKFLKKEIQTLKRDVMYKNNYILTIKHKYNVELEYYRNKIITEYETIIYEMNYKNIELEQNINKLKYDIQDLEARLINTNANYNLLCSICMINTKNICLEPCNHLCICDKCILDYKHDHCPICRHTISNTRKIYL